MGVRSDLHVRGTSNINALRVESPNINGTFLNLANTSASGAVWSLVSTGPQNGEGAGKLLIRSSSGPAPSLVMAPTGVGIGVSSPQSQLHLVGGSDASPSTGGTLQLGSTASTNLVFDSNEILARNNGAVGTLFLNFDGGAVQIGNTANQVANTVLEINGNAAKPGGGAWSVLSDRTAKSDIKPLAGTLDRLLKLHGYSFRYSDEALAQGGALPGTQLGLMAQEVQQVFPDWVSTDDKGRLNVTERATTALMVEALRDLRAEKDAQIAERDAEIAELNARLERLEKAVGGGR